MNRFSFTIFLFLFFVQKGFNFVLKVLLNPFIFVSTSETVLECFCPEGFTKSVHACFDLRIYFKIFLSRRVACFDLRKYFRIFLSRRICSVRSCLFWPQKLLEYFCQGGFTRSIQIELVLNGLLNPFMIYFVLKDLLNH